MKELLATGTAVAILTLFGASSVGPECRTDCREPLPIQAVEGFVPHERVTLEPVRERETGEVLLANFGSEAYL